jgi:hypothetical protein
VLAGSDRARRERELTRPGDVEADGARVERGLRPDATLAHFMATILAVEAKEQRLQLRFVRGD